MTSLYWVLTFDVFFFFSDQDDSKGIMDQAIGHILDLKISDDEENDGRVSSAMTDYSDEEDPHLDLPAGKTGQLHKNLQKYLEQMDRELAKTAVGQSFVRQNGAHTNGQRKSSEAENQQPPHPNGGTKRQHSVNSQNGSNGSHHQHKKTAPNAESDEFDEDGDDEDDYRPVDLNVNLLKNILESCSSEQGMPGPASNMLKRMGVNVPPNNGNDSDDE